MVRRDNIVGHTSDDVHERNRSSPIAEPASAVSTLIATAVVLQVARREDGRHPATAELSLDFIAVGQRGRQPTVLLNLRRSYGVIAGHDLPAFPELFNFRTAPAAPLDQRRCSEAAWDDRSARR